MPRKIYKTQLYMAKLVINSDIVDEVTRVIYEWEGFNGITSQDIVDFINKMDANDTLIDIRLHCNGGSVTEGWRIYDALRTSGKEITATIEGMCASMASVILLAAPKERRFAYKNAKLCIHNPEACGLGLGCPSRLTAEEIEGMSEKLRIQAESLKAEQEKIVNLYVERTGSKAEDLQELMDKDTFVDMDKAIELGFISSTIQENTASVSPIKNNNINMDANKTTEVNTNLLTRILSHLGFKKIEDVKFNDIVLTAVDGTEITIQKESGVPAINDVASPDGDFTLLDGTSITIKDGIISSLKEPAKDILHPETKAVIKPEDYQTTIDALYNDLVTLRGEKDALDKTIAERDTTISEMQSRIDGMTELVTTDEQRSILAFVDECGGIEALRALKNSRSNGAPQAGVNDPKKNGMGNDSLGEGFIDSIRKRRFI